CARRGYYNYFDYW
nr:immunoglobulin heavy chain junction region [Mus musculus]